ncbi:MAG: FdtA/QdtA family cupin domain-containing protein [Patescibacteria group bacterium]
MDHLWKIVDLQCVRTSGKPGLLAIAELPKHVLGLFSSAPRVYFIVNDSGDWSVRGGHFHPEGGKKELIIALQGRIEFDLHAAAGCGREVLESPTRGLVIPNGVWHGVRLSPGAILLSIASTLYAPDEAIAARPCQHRDGEGS